MQIELEQRLRKLFDLHQPAAGEIAPDRNGHESRASTPPIMSTGAEV